MPLIKSWSLLCNDNYCWKGSSDIGLLTQQKCCFIPSVLVRDNKMPVMTTSVASERRLCVLSRLFICVVQIVCVIKTVCIIIIMYIYHALINTLSAHMMHIKLNTIFYTHVEHLPKQFTYYMETHACIQACTHAHVHMHTVTVAGTGYWYKLGWKYCEKRKVFSLALKNDRVKQCLRSCGRELQVWGPKQEKAWKPWLLRLYCWIFSM